jgi:hypothetical protein
MPEYLTDYPAGNRLVVTLIYSYCPPPSRRTEPSFVQHMLASGIFADRPRDAIDAGRHRPPRTEGVFVDPQAGAVHEVAVADDFGPSYSL